MFCKTLAILSSEIFQSRQVVTGTEGFQLFDGLGDEVATFLELRIFFRLGRVRQDTLEGRFVVFVRERNALIGHRILCIKLSFSWHGVAPDRTLTHPAAKVNAAS